MDKMKKDKHAGPIPSHGCLTVPVSIIASVAPTTKQGQQNVWQQDSPHPQIPFWYSGPIGWGAPIGVIGAGACIELEVAGCCCGMSRLRGP